MTHARFVTVNIQPGKSDEVITIFRDSVLPAIQQQPGFQGTRLLVDRTNHKVVMVTLWQTEAHMLATEANGFLRQELAKFGNLFTAPPTRESYELAISI